MVMPMLVCGCFKLQHVGMMACSHVNYFLKHLPMPINIRHVPDPNALSKHCTTPTPRAPKPLPKFPPLPHISHIVRPTCPPHLKLQLRSLSQLSTTPPNNTATAAGLNKAPQNGLKGCSSFSLQLPPLSLLLLVAVVVASLLTGVLLLLLLLSVVVVEEVGV